MICAPTSAWVKLASGELIAVDAEVELSVMALNP
jgi:hypothetical protein